MDFYELVTKAVGDLRKRQGLTPDALAKQSVLLRLLDTDDEYEGVERLKALAYKLGDDQDAKMLRSALGVGVDRLKNATARRTVARENGTFYGSVRAGFDAEDRAIKRLVALLLKEPGHTDPFEQAAQTEPLDVGDGSQTPAVEESAVPTTTLKVVIRRRRTVVLAVACLGAAAIIAPAAWDGETDKKVPRPSASTSPVAIPESDIDHTSGWGPERKMYSVKKPAPYAVFNSLTDAYSFGDEREFLMCHEKEERVDERNWSNRIAAKDGQHYDCSAWFSNAVAPNLDEGNPAAQLHNARMMISVPAGMPVFNPGLVAEFTADNAQTVWASCNFVAEKPITIHYIPNSTYLTTKKTKEKYGGKGLRMFDGDYNPYLSDAKKKDLGGIAKPGGALIGEEKQDGIVRQASGWVQFTILVKFADKAGQH